MRTSLFRLGRALMTGFILALAPSAFAQTAKPAAQAAPPSPAQVQASKAEASRISDAIVSVADKVSPSVVQIDVTARDEGSDKIQRWLGQSGDTPIARAIGSGVIYTPDGAI